MNLTHVRDELSAYIDGEARNPERIARHLQSCPDCARYHLELLKISTHLRALHAPDVAPAFTTRVAARAAGLPRRRFFEWRLAPRFAGAVCAAVLAGVFVLRLLPESPAVDQTAGQHKPVWVDVTWRDDELVVNEFRRLMDAGVDLEIFGNPSEGVEELEPVALDEVLDVLAEDALDAGPVSDGPEDLGELLDVLADLDARTLSELLQAYGGEV